MHKEGLTANAELLRRGWTFIMVRCPSCPPSNGANKSNDNDNEWDYDTMCSTRSYLNSGATIENVTEIRACTRGSSRESIKLVHAELSQLRMIPKHLMVFVPVEETR